MRHSSHLTISRQPIRKLGTALTLVVATAFAAATPAAAEPGDLDGAFGTCGALTQQNEPARIGDFSGKVVSVTVTRQSEISSDLAVRRFNATGSLDRAFGVRGRMNLSVYGTAPPEWINEVATDPQGRLVISLNTYFDDDSANSRGSILRLLSNGTLDPTFSGGLVVLERGTGTVLVAPDGGILGNHGAAAGLDRMNWFRLNEDGSSRLGFTLQDPPNVAIPWIGAPVAIRSSGQILAVDRSYGSAGRISAWHADGTIDASFAPIPFPSYPGFDGTSPLAITTTAADEIVVLYSLSSDDTDLGALLARYLPSGAVDIGFGTDGSLVVPANDLSWTYLNGIHVDDDGTIQVTSYLDDGETRTVRAIQVTRTGRLDAGFGFRAVSDFPGYARTGIATTEGSLTASVVFPTPGLFNPPTWALVRASRSPLKQGAGLMLQWNGDAWPTRFSSDPGPECPYDTPYFPDEDMARGITTVTGKGGYVLDGWGGIHRFSIGLQHPKPAAAIGGPYWPGWNIARGIASKRNGSGGYVLDGFGGLHPFSTGTNAKPPATIGGPYWLGWDITRGVALLPDGKRGYVLDGFGGIHRFTTPGTPLPPRVTNVAYWPGWDIARGISVLPDGTGGYVVDAYGGTHPFGIGTNPAPPRPGPGAPYAPGEDWVRGFTFIAPKPVPAPAAASLTAAVTNSIDALRDNLRHRGGAPTAAPTP